MKTLIPFVFLLITFAADAQITSPVIRANFGIDAEGRSNYFNNFVQNGNDDWFSNSAGTGQFIIDTTGATAMVNQYQVDPAFRRLPFFRTMRFPQYSVVNNRLLIDAIFIRDYHGEDSTCFSISNKNGQSPADWNTPISQPLPNKDDIEDMFVHMRRAGPTKDDSLWFIGGLSLIGTTGNRYFDFELYQTDIFYERATRKFYNYGPDAGHTTWRFDAEGNIIAIGDAIFTAEYGSSSLTGVEARIWVHRSSLSLTPKGFTWGGQFDGDGSSSDYGYANIRPKVNGTFYTGLQSGNNTWAGPFRFIDAGNNVQTNYEAKQFMEFSINLSKLGLDPITVLGGGACGLPFRRILVKTRTSTSFSSELKDFIGPFDFFRAPPLQAQADIPVYCGVLSVSQIQVTNPLPTSVYNWTTPDGHIVGSTTGASITVDKPGTYMVSQQLLDGCGSYARDTVAIVYDSVCTVLEKKLQHFGGSMEGSSASLEWTVLANETFASFDVERSTDGRLFLPAGRVEAQPSAGSVKSYFFREDLGSFRELSFYYRVRLRKHSGELSYARIIKLSKEDVLGGLLLYPNPARQQLHLSLPARVRKEVVIRITDAAGHVRYLRPAVLQAGSNVLPVPEVARWAPGLYTVQVMADGVSIRQKFVVAGTQSAPWVK